MDTKQQIEEILYDADISDKESKRLCKEILKLIEENYVSKEQQQINIAANQGIELANFRKFILLHTHGHEEWFGIVFNEYLKNHMK
jgi:hypothetical protein